MGARKGLSGLHRDILNGDDETLDPVDFLPGMFALFGLSDVHKK
jgi:hypothetical protein